MHEVNRLIRKKICSNFAADTTLESKTIENATFRQELEYNLTIVGQALNNKGAEKLVTIQ